MPQLTPKFERVISQAFPSPQATHFDITNYMKLMILGHEIRISEDYCHKDIILVDYSNFTLGHVPEVSFTDIKKYELCLSGKYIFNTNCLLTDLPIL